MTHYAYCWWGAFAFCERFIDTKEEFVRIEQLLPIVVGTGLHRHLDVPLALRLELLAGPMNTKLGYMSCLLEVHAAEIL